MIILMIATNIIYFFMWYNDQKKESLYDMNMNYSQYAKNMDQSNIESFKDYLLQKDVLIIPNNGEEILCSQTLEEKSHTDLTNLQEKFIYKFGEKYYVVYSQYYKEIGEVKVFFDTTNYIKSQLMILQISLCIIIFAVILNYFL
jgi:hydroxymethylpyrimidine/phosphomethylpyrimidine kinase